MSLRKLLIEKAMFHDSIEDVVRFLKGNAIALKEKIDYYIDSGANGDVYSVGDTDKVLKIEKYGRDLYNVNLEFSKIESEHVVKYYFIKHVDRFIISVMEYLKPSTDYLTYSDSFFETFIMYIEDALQAKSVSFSYKKTNVSQAKMSLIRYGKFKEYDIDKLIKEFNTGDEILIRCILSIIVNRQHMVGDSETFVEDLIQNKQFISDIYYGLNDIMDQGVMHGDVHVDNILYDEKTKNFKLIDPWVL